jgi:hypothetical protein
MIRTLIVLGCLVFLQCTGSRQQAGDGEYLNALEEVASSGGEFWVRVHAMEFLIELGEMESASKRLPGFAMYESEPQKRIGYWRMKHRVEGGSAAGEWIGRIKDAYTDPNGPDRVHAAETLAKLNYSLQLVGEKLFRRDTVSGGPLAAFVKWGLVLPKEPEGAPDYELLMAMIEGENATEKKIAAYACGFFQSFPEPYAQRLVTAALAEPEISEANAYLLLAAYIHGRELNGDQRAALLTRFSELSGRNDKTSRISFCRGVAASGDLQFKQDLESLFMLEDPLVIVEAGKIDASDQDVRAAAAFALKKLKTSKT